MKAAEISVFYKINPKILQKRMDKNLRIDCVWGEPVIK
jgi:hypothetical protein